MYSGDAESSKGGSALGCSLSERLCDFIHHSFRTLYGDRKVCTTRQGAREGQPFATLNAFVTIRIGGSDGSSASPRIAGITRSANRCLGYSSGWPSFGTVLDRRDSKHKRIRSRSDSCLGELDSLTQSF